MKKIIMLLTLMFSKILLAENISNLSGLDLGTGVFADKLIEPTVDFFILRYRDLIPILIVIAVIFIILDFVMYALESMIQEKYTNFAANMLSRVATYMIITWILVNLFSGKNLFLNLIFKPIFITIPTYLVGDVTNLDTIWDLLMAIPTSLFNTALSYLTIGSILFGYGAMLILIMIICFVMYVQVAFLYLKIISSIIHIFIIAFFSSITIIFNFNEKLSSKWGGLMIKTYIILCIQYTMLFAIFVNIKYFLQQVMEYVNGGFLGSIIGSPIKIFIIVLVLHLIIKFAYKAVDLIVTVSNNM